VGRIGPMNCRGDKSCVNRCVRARVSRRAAASVAVFASFTALGGLASRMNVIVITPARPSSRSGNRTTALRWAGILRGLGHRVRVATDYDDTPVDLMIALHAWRSASALWRFRQCYPDRALVVGLAGTDLYEYLESDPKPTLRSLECADRLVALQDLAQRRLPPSLRTKVRVIYQSAQPLVRRKQSARLFEVAVVAHLRAVKDPLRAAKAARRLPVGSRLRVVHVGAATSPRWAARARAEMATNPRYRWRGEVPHAEVRRLLGRVQAVVLSSRSEGGANVISEALIAGVPVLASRVDGSLGLLGRDYPGYFAVGDTAALARLLHRIEIDPPFLAGLRQAASRRSALFHPDRETAAWKKLVGELCQQPGLPGKMRARSS
jgi:putative glycosyltransferase (TIGR04348 family)